MRTAVIALACLAASPAIAQTVTSVYNRDTHEPFKLKDVSVRSTVIGPIVRTSTWLTYDNPYKTPTEATLNFEMPDAAALSGFAYRYGDEYVPGRLMDKAEAWSIYTAITSRGRDPGIMEQWSPTTYHCQIFPIKQGRELRVRLYAIGLVGPDGALPKPRVPNAVSFYDAQDTTVARPKWTVRSVASGPVERTEGGYAVGAGAGVTAVAQRFRDGRTYVAGLVRASGVRAPTVEIQSARYETPDGSQGADVTAKVGEMVREGTRVRVDNSNFGDPAFNVVKQLRVVYRLNGALQERVTPEYQTADLADTGSNAMAPSFWGLRQPQTVRLDNGTYAFSGWLPKNGTIRTRYAGKAMAFRPKPIPNGADAARLWAQQMLAQGSIKTTKAALAFSMKYGVPSSATALLAVPQAEMALYRAKEREYQRAQADARRQTLAQERQARAWTKTQPQNWTNTGGGDPEIRITIRNAVRVEAILPDRRVLSLKADGDVWGGNFEVPATAAEGTYRVRIVAHLKDGTTVERTWTYEVDRTPPKGTATDAEGVLTVVSEPGLPEVVAYGPDGSRWPLTEGRPGTYSGKAPKGTTILLKDRAGNKGEATWSSSR